jgi:hypothetical protein
MQNILNFARRYRVVLMGANLLLLLIVTLLSPLEQTLGWKARAVYFHGAWVWTGKIAFALAAAGGLLALVLPRMRSPAADWSLSLGRTGLFFWLTYLPMSLWVQVISWGGIFWDEPRWRVPFAFGIAAILLQVALAIFDNRLLTAAGNLIFGAALWWALGNVQNVLHPNSPIFGSGSLRIEEFFVLLVGLSLAFMAQLALAFYRPKA